MVSDKQVNLGSGKCTESSQVWNHFTPQTVLKQAISRDFILKNSACGWEQFRNLLIMKNLALFLIWFYKLFYSY